jgi:sugar/nucleoside kinase (ribokinase family)
VERLAADARRLHDAVVFACASGALTCTRPGAIAAQPTLQECERLFAGAAEREQ